MSIAWRNEQFTIFIIFSTPVPMGNEAPARQLLETLSNRPFGFNSTSPPPKKYLPGFIPAGKDISEVSMSLSGPFTLKITRIISGGRWWPSAIMLTVRLSISSWGQSGLKWRWIRFAQPLPRCVLNEAPALTASRILSAPAFVCPKATTILSSTHRWINSRAPSSSGAKVICMIFPRAASL